ncbi:trypsin domain-containing protein [Clostridium sartagoforme AAU1]|uniref:Trypsin domain-containing protein n=2 Tax=root TaxID=1 RepID=R9BZ79_9CLOT|nr:trypsin-like peptidase domain-containing protein [Clostridium sartagoforme]EOR20276.1 trypsin domain-containing protein [Clostridium sartagoforme AAU1]
MSDDNIYDVENYEDVSNEETEVLRTSVEENTKEDYTDEHRFIEVNNNFNPNKDTKVIRKKKSGGFKFIVIALITGLLGGAIGGGSVYYAMKDINANQKVNNITPNPQTFNTTGEALTKSEAFEKVAPAVVIVSANGVTDYSGIIPQQVDGMGSGFIINEEGYILTNYHVIEGAKEVIVTLSDGRDVKAKVVNYDQNQDIAMLKLTDDSIKVPAIVELGNSDALKPGEEVLAIGTPLSKDFNQTVTGGLVSAVNRTVETSTGVKLNLIQTDAAINPGNSGGPLINTKGEVVGINTLKMSGEAEGIGFSIPINEVKDRIDSLSKPILNLGVSIREINEQLAKQYDMEEGLYIIEVTEFSPAEKAGLKSGDLIVKFDGQRIKTFDELRAIRDTKKEGDVVKVEAIRNGQTKSFDIQLEVKE